VRKAIRFTKQAKTDLRAIDRETAMRILGAIDHLSLTGEGDVKALSHPLRGNRLRVGQWRILFEAREQDNAIEVQSIKNRSDAYR
jgi:mRNA-degrading endonuclease RelE of RelBE toxin-antitoxin system